MIHVTWEEVRKEAERIAKRWDGQVFSVYGIPQGGAPLAVMISEILKIPMIQEPQLGMGTLVIDDLIDSGRTMKKYFGQFKIDAGFRKPHSPTHYAPDARLIDDWISFPWEKNDGAPTDGIARLIEYIGEDPSREGLIDTPERVLKAFKEQTEGYALDPKEILSTTFDVECNEMVLLRSIPFSSLCEHHLLPFTGTIDLAYIPGKRVVGLSKLARLVDVYGKRLQVQERMTQQIRQAIDDHLSPQGAACIVRGHHSCMSLRGIKKPGEMITSSFSGRFRTDSATRAEFLDLTN